MKIILNGQQTEVIGKPGRRLTYEEIAAMAYQPTVTFSRGHKDKPEGTVIRRGNVKIVEGTTITCIRTGSA